MYESQKINIRNLLLQNFAFGFPLKPNLPQIIAFTVNVILFMIQLGLLFLKSSKVTNIIVQSVFGCIITWFYFVGHVIKVPFMSMLLGVSQRKLKVYQAAIQSVATTITLIFFYYSYNSGYFNWIVGLFFVYQLSIIQRYTSIQLGKSDLLRNLEPSLSACMYINLFIMIYQACLVMGRLTSKLFDWACYMFISMLPFLMAFGIIPTVVQLLALILDASSVFFKIPLKPLQTSIFTVFYIIFFVISPYEAVVSYTFICVSMIKFSNPKVNICLTICRWVVSLSMFVLGIGFKIAKLSLYKVWYQPECLIIPQLICNLGIGMSITCTTCIYIFNHENNTSISTFGFGRRHVRIFNCYVYPVFALLLSSLQLLEIVQCFDNYLYFNCILTAFSIGNLLFDRPAASYGGAIGCGIAIAYLRHYENYIPSLAAGMMMGTYGYDVFMRLWYGFQYVAVIQSAMKRNSGLWLLMYIPNSLFICISSLLLSPMIQINLKIPLFIPSFMRPRYWDIGRLERLKFNISTLQSLFEDGDADNQLINQLLNHQGDKQLKHIIQDQFWRKGDGLLLLGPDEGSLDDISNCYDNSKNGPDFREVKTPNSGLFCLVNGQDLINNSICVSVSPIRAYDPTSLEEVRTVALSGIIAQNRRHSVLLRKYLIKTFNIQRGAQQYGSQKPDPRFSPSSLITYAGSFSCTDPHVEYQRLQELDNIILQRLFIQLLHEVIRTQQHWLFFMDRIPRPQGEKVTTISEFLDMLPGKDDKIEEYVLKLCYLDKFKLYSTLGQFYINFGAEGNGMRCSLYKNILKTAYRTLAWAAFTKRLISSPEELLKEASKVCFALPGEDEFQVASLKAFQLFKVTSPTTAQLETVKQAQFHVFRLHGGYFQTAFATAEHFRWFYGADRAEIPRVGIPHALYQTLIDYAFAWEHEAADGYIL